MVGRGWLTALVGEDDVAGYQRDGVGVLRGLFAGDWLDVLRDGVERNLAEPGPYAGEHGEGQGRFFDDYCNWERIPEYRAFVYESLAAAVATAVMQSPSAQFFHEHVLVKEPGTAKHTPWHQDAPYYCADGRQTVSFWIPLDPVPRDVCPEFIAGWHRWEICFIRAVSPTTRTTPMMAAASKPSLASTANARNTISAVMNSRRAM